MKRFAISIIWRGYRWHLVGIACRSFDLLCGLLEHIPPGAYVSVRAL